jgi:hypothetical protein
MPRGAKFARSAALRSRQRRPSVVAWWHVADRQETTTSEPLAGVPRSDVRGLFGRGRAG